MQGARLSVEIQVTERVGALCRTSLAPSASEDSVADAGSEPRDGLEAEDQSPGDSTEIELLVGAFEADHLERVKRIEVPDITAQSEVL